tara:strand:+ start:3785 stop:5134 length:1350 start_codon:yes stop_codon:yes gene_type:complete
MEYKYTLGVPITLFSFILLYFYINKGKSNITYNSKNNNNNEEILKKLEKNDILMKTLLINIVKMMKKENVKLPLDKVNKNSIFNKDYQTKRLLIETNTLIKNDRFKFGNYVYSFVNPNLFTINSSVIGNIKNIIGFRLTKAIIPNKFYTINSSNDILLVIIDNIFKEIKLIHGSYNYNTLYQCIPIDPKFNHGIYIKSPSIDNNYGISKTKKHIIFECKKPFSLMYDKDILKNKNYNINKIVKIINVSKIFGFKFLKKYKSNPIQYAHEHTTLYDHHHLILHPHEYVDGKTIPDYLSKQINCNNDIYNLLFTGTDPKPYTYDKTYSFKHIHSAYEICGDTIPNLTIDYIDLVIDELPYMALKWNTLNKNVIERIPLNNVCDENIIYAPDLSYKVNYFNPISLNKLSISLLEPMGKQYYNPQNVDHSFEFEITYIRNEEAPGIDLIGIDQ